MLSLLIQPPSHPVSGCLITTVPRSANQEYLGASERSLGSQQQRISRSLDDCHRGASEDHLIYSGLSRSNLFRQLRPLRISVRPVEPMMDFPTENAMQAVLSSKQQPSAV